MPFVILGEAEGSPLCRASPAGYCSFLAHSEKTNLLSPLVRGGYKAGIPLQSSINPNPFFIRMGFNLILNPSPIIGEGLNLKVAETDDFQHL